ncbi:hypothetical protein [Bacillus pseudomycoides]|uniref:hypothetical protein n=1 Tax=Bacillus pseudomycoides TaxID=64104 RepID=UPI003000E260
MTPKENARLRGFWTNKKTGEYIALKRVVGFSDVHVWPVNAMGHEIGPREIMLLRDLKKEYVKGMR